MKTVRLIATFLFFLTRGTALLFLVVALYAIIVILLHEYSSLGEVPMRVLDNGSFEIFYPFTQQPFLLGDYTKAYLITSMGTIVLYGLFLWLLSGVFNAFKQERIFTPRGVGQLALFYRANLTVPIICLLLLGLFTSDVRDFVIITFLHLM